MVVTVCHVYSSVRIYIEGLGKVVNSPLNKLKDAVNTLRQHSNKSYHMHAVSDMLKFMQVMSNERQPIDHQLVSALAQQVQTNRHFFWMEQKYIVIQNPVKS